ncbi:hypothetical protein BDW02DRAFT_502040, partial [Decorospora gaudefroyi]
GQKSALMVLFASGVVCIFIAILRAANITANTIETNALMDGTWLAVWGMIETAVAVIIGLCPSFASLIRATRKTTKKPAYNVGGYVNQDGQGFQLQTIGSTSRRAKKKKSGTDDMSTFWTDAHGSQEELAGDNQHDGISVPTTM